MALPHIVSHHAWNGLAPEGMTQIKTGIWLARQGSLRAIVQDEQFGVVILHPACL